MPSFFLFMGCFDLCPRSFATFFRSQASSDTPVKMGASSQAGRTAGDRQRAADKARSLLEDEGRSLFKLPFSSSQRHVSYSFPFYHVTLGTDALIEAEEREAASGALSQHV